MYSNSNSQPYLHKVVLSVTSHLRQEINQICQESINWDSFYRTHAISSEEIGLLVSYDGASVGQRNKLLQSNGFIIASVLYGIIWYENSGIVLKYALSLIHNMLEVNLENANLFYVYAIEKRTTMWRPYYRLLNNEDPFIMHVSGVIVTQLALWEQNLMEVESMKFFLSWLLSRLKEKKLRYQHDNIRCLQMLLQRYEYRSVFDTVDGVSFIIDLLRHRNNSQIQYQLIFCVWVLTFNKEIAAKDVMTNTAIKLLAEGLKDSAKVKVIRITLAVYTNLLTKPDDPAIIKQNCNVMIGCRLLKQLNLLVKQKFVDEELVADLSFLVDYLRSRVEEFSSFDLYVSELMSGELRWSPAHKSSDFWIKNVQKLNENNYALLRVLIEHLDDAGNPKVLSIACFDIGQYVQYYPPGKKIIEQLGAKNIVMSFLQHSDPSVRYEALITVQKILVHNLGWLQSIEEEESTNQRDDDDDENSEEP
ncbi:hypothetical protein L9F63_013483 [Diploptera punctata]|uniref:V-type proton ATPase subunit H n=1 Tax=Diploptera punctata TaxID=6984 RepID=A0AAD8AA30_DIPPU|nr:hypothetical protein L9F63_013483 [Diploptera punctata]